MLQGFFETPIGAAGEEKTPLEAGATMTRQQALNLLGELPEDIQQAIKARTLILIDRTITGTRVADTQKVEIFKKDDNIIAGRCSLSKAQLEADEHFICTAILLEQSSDADNFVPAPFDDAMHAAEFSLNVNGNDRLRTIHTNRLYTHVPDAVIGDSSKAYGFYKLDTPIYIQPQKTIQFSVESEQEITGALRVTLIGMQTIEKPNIKK